MKKSGKLNWGQLTDSFECLVKDFECYFAASGTTVEQLEEQYKKIHLAVLLGMD